MRSNRISLVAAVATLAACGGKPTSPTADGGRDAGTDPCACTSGACIPFIAGTTTEAQIDAAFATADGGTTLAFGPGAFNLVNTLQVGGQKNLTVAGAGIDVTILDFSHQRAAGSSPDGIRAQDVQGLTLHDLTVQNTAGSAFRVSSSQNIVFERVKATWATPLGGNGGPYGIYPVTATNVLIENSQVSGASNSGIYVAQSTNVVCRNNTATGNVAGIEVASSSYVDVLGNDCHDNTGGILVFDLPNPVAEGGHDIHVHGNQMVGNNGANFATNGDLVSIVPAGTGFLVMASHGVEVDDNTVTGNATIGMAAISYFLAQLPVTDPNYDPYPRSIWIHDNTVSGNGTSPDASTAMGLLLLGAQNSFPGLHAPDLAWDGVYDPVWAGDAGTLKLRDAGPNPNPAGICFTHNGSTETFVDLNLCQLEIYGTDGGITCPGLNPVLDGGVFTDPVASNDTNNLASIETSDIVPFGCTAPTVGSVDAGVDFPDGGNCGR